jgi:glycosyltransferase involved in cell wall biosynthesis
MRVLLWHGYLLRGTGSNIYKANVVREWRRAGHDVLLMCQERDLDGLDFVDAHGDFAPSNRTFVLQSTDVRMAHGRVTLLRPAIGELLPVYVYDRYDGFAAKRYVDLADSELNSYVDSNVRALSTAIEQHDPEAIVASHEIMGPYIALQAGRPYAAQLHGSALEYAIKEDPDRYLPFAMDGLCGAHRVIGGSDYMVREASSVIPGWRDKAAVVNPGCDTELFRPAERTGETAPIVGYVGKLIAQKGVHNLLAGLGLTRTPGLGAVVVGFGDFEPQLRALWAAAQSGDRAAMKAIVEEHDDPALERLARFLESSLLDDIYFRRVSEIEARFPGRLEHGPLSLVLPTFDLLVVPSVLAEAFGMVAAEAAACGVLPIVPNHSGIAEVGAALEAALDRPGLLTFDHSAPVEGIAASIDEILAIPAPERREMGLTAAEVARERWSWPTVARRLLECATPPASM